MSSVKEIEEAVLRLLTDELAAFRKWFAEFDADAWDRRIEEDIVSGRLDKFASEALTISARAAARSAETPRESEVLALLPRTA